MLNRSTILALAAAAALADAAANVAGGAGVWDNAAEADRLLSQAVPLNGRYRLTGKHTGRTLTYLHNDQPNIFPSESPLEALIEMFTGKVDHPVAEDVFTLYAFDDNTVRIRFDDADKCLAAQWNFDDGMDTYGVAYGCNLGPGATYDTGLRDEKQQYLVLPVSGSSSSGSGSGAATGGGSQGASAGGNVHTSSSDSDDSEPAESDDSDDAPAPAPASDSGNGVACEKDPEWVYRHPPSTHADYYRVHPECLGTMQMPECRHDQTWLQRHSDYVKDHPECEATFRGEKKRSVHHRRGSVGHGQVQRGVLKRGESMDVQLVCLDHLRDMRTRAVSSVEITAFAEAKAAFLDLYTEGQEDQIWTLTAV